MNLPLLRALPLAFVTTALVAPAVARAHFVWLAIEPAEGGKPARIRAFFNENPLPNADFVKYVREIPLKVDGQVVPSDMVDEAREARWLGGKLPAVVDAERDLGVSTRGDKAYRLFYTARAQATPVAAETPENGDKLRVRLVQVKDAPTALEVLFDGKPVPQARIKVYPDGGEPKEMRADDQGRAVVEGLADGTAALWANHTDATPGTLDGKEYGETRYYATFTYAKPSTSASDAQPAAFATMPEPAVNSFGGAVLGNWLYVYSGHVGRTHSYDRNTTSKHFRRLNLADRSTWEELPMGPDLQGVALVSDGKYLYRTGGMSARNEVGEPSDLHSSASCARFDPALMAWTDLPAMPLARSTHDAAIVGRSLFVVGGWTMKGESEESEFLDNSIALDLDRPEAGWKSIEQPFMRRALAAAEHGGKLYVLGGLVGGGMSVDRRVDVYDPKTKAWTRGPDIPKAGRNDGFGVSAFSVDGRLYESGMSGRIFRLSESGDSWEAIGSWDIPRITHRLLPGLGNTILAVGGTSRTTPTPIVEAIPLDSPMSDPSLTGK
ncbi:MAG: galactose oxidase [Isosphaeraceae bacterium]